MGEAGHGHLGWPQTSRISFSSVHFCSLLVVMLRIILFTFKKCLLFKFPGMIRTWFFAFIKCLSLRLPCFGQFYFLTFLLAELKFAYFCSHYFFSFLSFIRSHKFSFSVLCVTYLLLFYCYLWFFTDPVLMYCAG